MLLTGTHDFMMVTIILSLQFLEDAKSIQILGSVLAVLFHHTAPVPSVGPQVSSSQLPGAETSPASYNKTSVHKEELPTSVSLNKHWKKRCNSYISRKKKIIICAGLYF